MKERLILAILSLILELALKSKAVDNRATFNRVFATVDKFDQLEELKRGIFSWLAWKNWPSFSFETDWFIGRDRGFQGPKSDHVVPSNESLKNRNNV